MVISDVVEWIITIGFVSIGMIFGYAFNRINAMKDELKDHKTVTAEKIGTCATSNDLEAVKDDLSEHIRHTGERFGEYIRRQEMDSILDRYESRIEKRFDELKTMFSQLIDKQ